MRPTSNSLRPFAGHSEEAMVNLPRGRRVSPPYNTLSASLARRQRRRRSIKSTIKGGQIMIYRELGSSGIEVSAVAFGAWAIGGWMWGGTG